MAKEANITDHIIPHDSFEDFSISLQKCIQNIIRGEGYIKHKVEKKLVPQAGNFTSFLYKVDITGETANGEKMTPLFIKTSITLDKITFANISKLYSRELFIYNVLSRMFETLQDAADIPDAKRFRFLKSYLSDNESVVMENLYNKGYKTYEKTQVVPLRFAELSIIELAKFHALSYVIKDKHPTFFEDRIKTIRSPMTPDSDWKGFIHNICAITMQVVGDEAKTKIANYAPRMIETYVKYHKDIVPSNGCLCHGDYKFHNIMVKEENGQASEVQPIDYQLVYYGNPVDDFLFFIFTGTDREFRKKHLSYLKDLYFEHFANFLSCFKVDVNSVYSRQEFENDYTERLELGLVYGLYLAAFTFAHLDEGFDVTTFSLSELPIIPDELFVDRVRGIVEDYIEWGIL